MAVEDEREATEDEAALAEALFATRAILAEVRPRPRPERVSFRDLVAYVTDPGHELSPAQQAALVLEPRLKADLARLEARLGLFSLPTAAAAADSELHERRFAGAVVRLRPSRANPRHLYVTIALDDPSRAPHLLLLRSAAGELHKEPLPVPDEEGLVQLIKDLDQASEARLVDFLRDPRTTGVFVGSGD